MQVILVDYNWRDTRNGKEICSVGFEDAWQLIGYDLWEGAPTVFAMPCELQMGGILRSEMAQGRRWWCGELDPSTLRYFLPADLGEEAARVQGRLDEGDDAYSFLGHGEGVVFYDYDAKKEVYGTVVYGEGGRLEGIPDWSTRRPFSELHPEAWEEFRRLLAEQEALHRAGGTAGGPLDR